jgi:translation initiation factor IF-2
MNNKETLEELAEKLQEEIKYGASISDIIDTLTKWQQEQDKKMYSEEEVLKAEQAILCNIKDALMNENYIIEYLNNLKTNKI